MTKDARTRMLTERRRVMVEMPEIESAAELAEEIQEDELRREYWRWQLENHLAGKRRSGS